MTKIEKPKGVRHTKEEIRDLVGLVQYRDWNFTLEEPGYSEHIVFLRLRWVDERCERQSGRRWALSTAMTRSEIVQTCLAAVLAAEEHEARERFRYKGKAPFNPHLDVEWLTAIHDKKDVRE